MADILSIRRVAIDSLHLDPSNARQHGEENLDAIVGSLRQFGQAEPLVVQKATGRVIGGNGRLVAMRKLGWTECDIVELDVDDLTATALGIALNRTAELASWDLATLSRLLEELRAEDALDGVGYSAKDIDALLAELADEAEPRYVEEHHNISGQGRRGVAMMNMHARKWKQSEVRRGSRCPSGRADR